MVLVVVMMMMMMMMLMLRVVAKCAWPVQGLHSESPGPRRAGRCRALLALHSARDFDSGGDRFVRGGSARMDGGL